MAFLFTFMAAIHNKKWRKLRELTVGCGTTFWKYPDRCTDPDLRPLIGRAVYIDQSHAFDLGQLLWKYRSYSVWSIFLTDRHASQRSIIPHNMLRDGTAILGRTLVWIYQLFYIYYTFTIVFVHGVGLACLYMVTHVYIILKYMSIRLTCLK